MKLNRAKITKGGEEYEGLILPSSNDEKIVLKLDIGYNMGIKREGAKVEILGELAINPGPEEPQQERGEIAILSMGGTICSRVEYKTGAVYPSTNPRDLMRNLPELERICSFHTKSLYAMLSEDLCPSHWVGAAEAAKEEIEKGAKGVLILHGTDTIHYSASALSYMLRDTPVPVIFVGAQRSPDRPSSDARLNLLNAAYLAKEGNIAHVGLCMHANTNDSYCEFHNGTRVRKMHTSARDAFRSIGAPPLARVEFDKNRIEELSPCKKRGGKLKFDSRISDNVALIYAHPGIKPRLIDSLGDYDGVVFAGTGLGHVPTNSFNTEGANSILPQIKSLCDSGVVVAMSSQCIEGRLNMNVYTAGRLLREAGVIGSGADWTPEAAYTKLCWVLGHQKDAKKAKEEMLMPLAGEITTRSVVE
ncbi:Glu-tRNA(Gln) amidotransferase subunit GatD [Candidatus Micrarchaeota archaeon]|nr:Glu-tRNA(Gln) amidotransferase subunit GatD [Candidatus Micrarchaeota archaeon]